MIEQLKGAVAGLRWQLLPSATAIQPLMIGDTVEAVRVSDALAARGLLVPAIRPPTVPVGTARLRISLSAAHEPRHIEQLAQALHETDPILLQKWNNVPVCQHCFAESVN